MTKDRSSSKYRNSIFLIVLICLFSTYWFFQEKRPPENHKLDTSLPIITNSANINSKITTDLNLQPATKAASGNIVIQRPDSKCLEKIEQELFSGEDNVQYQKRLKQSLKYIVGEWFYINGTPVDISEVNSKREKFLYALASADLLIGLKTKVKLDYKLALKLLTEVSNEDPNNSAPLLYAAIINEQIKDYSASKELINKALELSTYFDTYILDFSKALIFSSESAEDFYRSNFIHASHPIPDHLKLRDLILKYKLTKISEQLIQNALDKNNLLADYEWSLIDYTVGVATLKKLSPDYKLPKFIDLMAQKNKLHDFNPEEFFEEFQKNCDMKLVENEFLFIKSHLDKK